jgi:benzoyl-CoA reductase/2-hydroxyglutaryl-CoA dehydratase subunit BcrC/BadD/HgdB
LTAKSVKDAVKTVNLEEEQARNFIIYGVKEPENGSLENKLKFDVAHDAVKSISEITDTADFIPVGLEIRSQEGFDRSKLSSKALYTWKLS